MKVKLVLLTIVLILIVLNKDEYPVFSTQRKYQEEQQG